MPVQAGVIQQQAGQVRNSFRHGQHGQVRALPDEKLSDRSGTTHLSQRHGTDRRNETVIPGNGYPGNDSGIVLTEQGERLGVEHEHGRGELNVRAPYSADHARLASVMTSSDSGPTLRSWSATISSAFNNAKPYSAA
ncbi:hypothetical protein [Nonomuraea sp. 10N515B]|uniref:hypothetical protein n=1 Tax=Nonomuraea sp. 10N515B TaxID=3457422 RepID=UPI003FCD6177